MPHDASGKLLAVGDKVNVPATITAIQVGEEYCNLKLNLIFQCPHILTKQWQL
jgi:hypothetical protein